MVAGAGWRIRSVAVAALILFCLDQRFRAGLMYLAGVCNERISGQYRRDDLLWPVPLS